MIVPSIDLMNGKAVRLRQGKDLILTLDRDPVDLARELAFFGDVAVIDLDAVLEKGDNRELISRICREAPCRIGGGIRTEAQARDTIRAGGKQLIFGTAATPGFLSRLPREWCLVALDARGGKVVDRGWTRQTGVSVLEKARELEPFCAGFLYTGVDRDGTFAGADRETALELQKSVSVPVTIAGGVSGVEEAVELDRLGFDVQVGLALHTGKLSLSEWYLKRGKYSIGDLLPTVVRDESGNVLMVAYSSRDSLARAMETKQGWYYSRSRRKLWRKGETSGNTQDLLRIRYDCDADTLLFTVRQTGPACHRGSAGCFGIAQMDPLSTLFKTICERGHMRSFNKIRAAKFLKERFDPDLTSGMSYTTRLLSDTDLLKRKILEEARETVEFTGRSNLAWEIADLMYHVSVLAVREGVDWSEIENELESRRKV